MCDSLYIYSTGLVNEVKMYLLRVFVSVGVVECCRRLTCLVWSYIRWYLIVIDSGIVVKVGSKF